MNSTYLKNDLFLVHSGTIYCAFDILISKQYYFTAGTEQKGKFAKVK